MTFSIIVDGLRWMHGLSKNLAHAEIELLRDQFPNSSALLIQEL